MNCTCNFDKEGWRAIEPDETIQEGDNYKTHGGGVWSVCDGSVDRTPRTYLYLHFRTRRHRVECPAVTETEPTIAVNELKELALDAILWMERESKESARTYRDRYEAITNKLSISEGMTQIREDVRQKPRLDLSKMICRG